MTHTYYVKGMSCSGCEATVKKHLEAVEGVSQVVANAKEKTAVVEMSQHVPFETLKTALEGTHY
ncbi:MAG: heavy-metal-associated domain-containing protein, partial [Capnocytophaga gingivalis]